MKKHRSLTEKKLTFTLQKRYNNLGDEIIELD